MPTAHATRPPRREPKPWSFRDLKARCRRLRDQLSIAATDVITPEELAAYWPGGGENAQEGIGAWIFCYAQMVRLAERMREPTPAQRPGTLYRSQVALTDATLDRAETVPLEAGEIVAVHPLSYEALELCATLNQVILFATEVAGQFAHQESAASEELRAFQPLVRSTAVRLWAWVITAGPALPFPVSADWPEPPEWTAAITPNAGTSSRLRNVMSTDTQPPARAYRKLACVGTPGRRRDPSHARTSSPRSSAYVRSTRSCQR